MKRRISASISPQNLVIRFRFVLFEQCFCANNDFDHDDNDAAHSCLKWPLEEIYNLFFEHLIQCNMGSKLEHLTKIFFMNTFFHGND